MDSVKRLSDQQLYVLISIVEECEKKGFNELYKRIDDERKARSNGIITAKGCLDDDLTDQQVFAFARVLDEWDSKRLDELSTALKEEIIKRLTSDCKGMNESIEIPKMVRFGLFDMFELVVLTENNISNMQELIEADLDSLKLNGESIPVYIRESLRFKRKVYNFTGFDSDGKKIDTEQMAVGQTDVGKNRAPQLIKIIRGERID